VSINRATTDALAVLFLYSMCPATGRWHIGMTVIIYHPCHIVKAHVIRLTSSGKGRCLKEDVLLGDVSLFGHGDPIHCAGF